MMVPQFRIRNSGPLSGLEGLGVQDTEDDSKEFFLAVTSDDYAMTRSSLTHS